MESPADTFYTLNTPDITPPSFVNGPVVSFVSTNTTTIIWETNENTTATLEYGVDSVDENQITISELSINHSVNLSGLAENSSYLYRVSITDFSGNGPVTSTGDLFITLSVPDTTPPLIINGPVAAYLADTSAVIAWETDEPGTSVLKAGTAPGVYSKTITGTTYVRTHTVNITGLLSDTIYYFTVQSTDQSGNISPFSPEDTFKTPKKSDTTPPQLKQINFIFSDTDAAITWNTDEMADSKVLYGTEPGMYVFQKYSGTLTTSHNIFLTPLNPLTTYYFQVISKDPAGNQSVNSEYAFTTLETGAVAPLSIMGITVSYTKKRVIITWNTNNKGDSQATYKHETESFWHEITDTKITTSHSIRLEKSELLTGTYYYKVKTCDEYNQELEISFDSNGNLLEFQN